MWFTPSFPSFLSLVLQQHFAQTATSSKGTEQGSNSLRLTARTLRWHHKQLRLIWASESHKESDINLSALILTQRGQKNTSYIYAAQVQAKKHHTWWTKKKKYIYIMRLTTTVQRQTGIMDRSELVQKGGGFFRCWRNSFSGFLWVLWLNLTQKAWKRRQNALFFTHILMDLYVSKLCTLFICYFHICQLNFR